MKSASTSASSRPTSPRMCLEARQRRGCWTWLSLDLKAIYTSTSPQTTIPSMKAILLFVTSAALLSPTVTGPVMAYVATRIGECYFKQGPNSTPVNSLDGCEIVSSTGQGYYYYEIRFSTKRQYVVKGGDSQMAWEDAPASLNGKPAKYFRQNEYNCWKKSNPYHEVCIK